LARPSSENESRSSTATTATTTTSALKNENQTTQSDSLHPNVEILRQSIEALNKNPKENNESNPQPDSINFFAGLKTDLLFLKK
jgi:hypothetical protein